MNQFNALNGTELLEAIVARIRRKLEDTGEFEQHRTFPLIKLTFSVGLAVYPKQNLDDEPLTKITDTLTLPEGVSVPPEEPVSTIAETESVVIDTPDLERKEAGLAITVPVLGLGGVIVDKPQAPKVKVVTPARAGKR